MLSLPHLVIIFLVALLVFGPEKLPELARTFGKAIAEFRRATGDLRAGFEEHMRELERETRISEATKQQANPPPRQPPFEAATQAGALPEPAASNAVPDTKPPDFPSTSVPATGEKSHSDPPTPQTVPEKAGDGDS